ncbi:MAG: hypothetical protein QM820_06305 [Minicystis sp.]
MKNKKETARAKSIQVCDLDYEILPAGAEGSTKILSIPLVPVIIVILA